MKSEHDKRGALVFADNTLELLMAASGFLFLFPFMFSSWHIISDGPLGCLLSHRLSEGFEAQHLLLPTGTIIGPPSGHVPEACSFP